MSLTDEKIGKESLIHVARPTIGVDNSPTFPWWTTGMSEVPAIRFTQDQVRTLTGVSVETIRHWRKTIPYLKTKTGKTARFTFTDVIGLAITNVMVTALGVQITTLSTGVDALFHLLTNVGASSFEATFLLLTPTDAAIYDTVGTSAAVRVSAVPSIMIPLGPLMAELQRHMLPMSPVSPQIALPFPPKAVA